MTEPPECCRGAEPKELEEEHKDKLSMHTCLWHGTITTLEGLTVVHGGCFPIQPVYASRFWLQLWKPPTDRPSFVYHLRFPAPSALLVGFTASLVYK